MNYNNICVFDFETGSRNKYKCQPTQIAALMLNPRTLQIIPGSVFNSEIRPILDDDEAIAAGLDPLDDEALNLTHKTREGLSKAPLLKNVWQDFVNYVKSYTKGNAFNAPVRCGYNICNFDNYIIDRLCQQYDLWDETWQTQKLFNPIHNIDIMHFIWAITENKRINSQNSIAFDKVREWLGMPTDNTHDALVDIIDTSELAIRFIKLNRHIVETKESNGSGFAKALENWTRPILT